MSSKEMKIAVGIVTFNRLEKLKKAVSSYFNQTVKPSYIFIFDNGSTDGTRQYLNELQLTAKQFNLVVFLSDRNLGGAGGFSNLIKQSFSYDYDWIWLSDDDAYPEPNCLELIANSLFLDDPSVGAICSSVIDKTGISYNHRRRIRAGFFGISEKPVKPICYQKSYFNFDLYSFVGTCLKKEAIVQCGLPREDFFIWFDDSEHSLRIRKKYNIICLPNVSVYHDVDEQNNGISWKDYYGYRNKLVAFKSNCSRWSFWVYFRIRNPLTMFVLFFTDKKRYFVKKDAIADFKKGMLGVSEKYYPGKKI